MEKKLTEKIADDLIKLQKIWVQIVKEKRGKHFKLSDWQPMLEVKNSLIPYNTQSKAVFDLYKFSAKTAYSILNSLTDHIFPEDEPWLEHYQTTAVFEILYEFDQAFKRSSLKVVEAIEKSGDLIENELFAKFHGHYGLTWVSDYVATPGSLLNLYERILDNVEIETNHKWTFLTAVSAARNTSYSVMFGTKFLEVLSEDKGIPAAVKAEKEIMKDMWLNPLQTQIQLMKEVHHRSFNYERCLKLFKEQMREVIIKAAESDLHYANLIVIPFWGAGDFHHISQTTYNMCKSDVEMAILTSLTKTFARTIEEAKREGKLKNPNEIPTWEVTAAGAAYIMRKDGFTSEMLSDLLTKRYYNLLLEDPKKFQYECMNDEFVNLLKRGECYLEKSPIGLGSRVYGIRIDFSPINNNEVLANPQRYAWPECPLTTRFSGLLRFADEPFHLISDPLICLYAMELISLNPKKPYLPFFYCKQCHSARLLPGRCKHCLAKKAIK